MRTTDDDGVTVETVLVVDDEVLVRMAIAAYLRHCGYRVIEAANADEAMLALEQHEGSAVGVVLSAVALSGEHDGFALAQWIRRHRPGCEVMLAGTTSRTADAAAEICEQGPMLSRPYEPQLVLDRIRRLRASRPPRV
jgi:DNA-binding NtrC family response regulator